VLRSSVLVIKKDCELKVLKRRAAQAAPEKVHGK
jgi:hypothetical protein